MQRSLIRVDADELTYPLHILLRYELEKKLLSGELAVRDLPEAWNAGMEQRLEVRPSGAAEGCLQDIHWALGSLRLFSLLCARRGDRRAAVGEPAQSHAASSSSRSRAGNSAACSAGCASTCTGMGAKVTVNELMKQATGQPLSASALLRYLEAKYLEERAREHGTAAQPRCGAWARACAGLPARRSPTTA